VCIAGCVVGMGEDLMFSNLDHRACNFLSDVTESKTAFLSNSFGKETHSTVNQFGYRPGHISIIALQIRRGEVAARSDVRHF